MDKISSVLSIEDPEEFKNAMPWGNFDPKSSNDKLMTQGHAIPPFHGRCRCVVVATAFTDVENPSRERTLDNAFGGTKREKELLKKVFADAPDEFMPLLRRYGREMDIVEVDEVDMHSAKAYCDPELKKIFIQKGFYGEREVEIIRHEAGHMFDYIFGREREEGTHWFVSYGHAPMYQAFLNDQKSFMGNSRRQKQNYELLRKAIMPKNSPYYNNAAVSDIFSSMSKGEMYGVSRHKPSYYAQADENAPAEVFANLMQLYLSRDNKAISYVRRYFPEVVKFFEKLLKEEIDDALHGNDRGNK